MKVLAALLLSVFCFSCVSVKHKVRVVKRKTIAGKFATTHFLPMKSGDDSLRVNPDNSKALRMIEKQMNKIFRGLNKSLEKKGIAAPGTIVVIRNNNGINVLAACKDPDKPFDPDEYHPDTVYLDAGCITRIFANSCSYLLNDAKQKRDFDHDFSFFLDEIETTGKYVHYLQSYHPKSHFIFALFGSDDFDDELEISDQLYEVSSAISMEIAKCMVFILAHEMSHLNDKCSVGRQKEIAADLQGSVVYSYIFQQLDFFDFSKLFAGRNLVEIIEALYSTDAFREGDHDHPPVTERLENIKAEFARRDQKIQEALDKQLMSIFQPTQPPKK